MWLYIDQYGEKKELRNNYSNGREKQTMGEREEKGCFFATLWSGPSTQRTKGKVGYL